MSSITLGRNSGYSGSGYVDMGGINSYVEWPSVDAGSGGACVLSFRYANGGSTSRPCEVKVNGIAVGTLQFPVTSPWSNYQYSSTIETQCGAGSNRIRITASTDAGGPNLDKLDFYLS